MSWDSQIEGRGGARIISKKGSGSKGKEKMQSALIMIIDMIRERC
jgi:hypothetical protein